MYVKKPAHSYRYNDPEDIDFPKIIAPEHTALLMIDMQNDFCSPEGKFAQAGRDAAPETVAAMSLLDEGKGV